ncbi:RDD family protein [Brevibacillus migulae]|uniref:RDD family protein n=1 Tax=Brevibacillus migulae TaxID=1644114 RepID=UPI00106E1812|nr:RDD family protein [Brevibacillus migulae]
MELNGELTPEQEQIVPTEYRYAGFWIRFVASLLDGIVMMALQFLIYFIAGVDMLEPPALLNLALTIVSIAYYVIMTVLLGQTLGKMALGIRVVRKDGGPNGWGWILLRETIGKFVSALILMIGYIMAGFDSKKRSLHDRMSRTYVVKA